MKKLLVVVLVAAVVVAVGTTFTGIETAYIPGGGGIGGN